jgi:hypothetical protein
MLDADRLAAEVALGDHPSLERIERVEEANRERAALSQSGAHRQIGVVPKATYRLARVEVVLLPEIGFIGVMGS